MKSDNAGPSILPEAESAGDVPHSPAHYLPPHTLMKRLIRRGRAPGGEETVTMAAKTFHKFVEAAAASLFDEAAYLARYEDIRSAVEAGRLHSGFEHFVTDGYLEGRPALRYAVDKEWYIQSYPDVAEAIASGKVRDAAHHFEAFGFAEGRVPNRALQKLVAEWRELEKKRLT